ncbi:hypothetical protein BDZ89DRAFT_1156600 [Hymenopellis radicata]|nr:hypothetical protein BDZ89DRAFT_1156600 [Hymenopellis radicata]
MARATRSAVTTDNSDQHTVDDTDNVAATKKRKRRSQSIDDEHASKQSRTDDDPMSSPPPHTALQNAADVPLNPEYASKILVILEAADQQALLDRVVPLVADPSSSSSNASQSLRTLLQNSPHHPLSKLKIAVENLFPPPSQSRLPHASKQTQFCRLALSLLEEASFHSVPFPLDRVTAIPDDLDGITDDSHQASASTSPAQPPRKYALVQHLPQGDYWTSLSSSLPPSSSNNPPDLSTGFSELVAVFPYPYPSTSEVPSLGSYHKVIKSYPSPCEQRKVTTGSFLDYGPWASFAPTFELEDSDVGRIELGQLCYDRAMRKRAAEEKRKHMSLRAARRMDREELPMDSLEASPSDRAPSIDLDGLLSPDDVKNLKSVLDDAEVLRAVEELLERNRKALLRLQELQTARLGKEDGGSSVVEQDSEEWEIAQSILDSLTLLASLRPRASSDDKSAIIPSPAALHALQRTLPLQNTPGWHGTLPPTQTIAIRDDSTVKVRAGATPAPAPTPAVSTVPVTPSPIAPTGSFASYNYNYNTPQPQTQYRSTGTPVQATATQSTFAAAGYRPGSATPSYYTNMAGQQGYAPQWYQYAQTAGTTNSGRGTPQPGVTTALSNQFTQYYPAAATAGRRSDSDTSSREHCSWGEANAVDCTSYSDRI